MKLSGLYRYLQTSKKRLLLPTPTLKHSLFAPGKYDPKKPIVYICEGPWDGMALWEALGAAKPGDNDELVVTASKKASLRNTANVIAVPGVTNFAEYWLPLFEGKTVVLMYDNDHDLKNPKSNAMIPAAGFAAMKRVAGILAASAYTPAAIRYLQWGENGWNPDLPAGLDVRDYLAQGSGVAGRVKQLDSLLGLVVDAPDEWQESTQGASKSKGGGMELLDCRAYSALSTSWRKALRWTDGLDCALSVMLASITSTKAVGDQLWVKIIGPASCGKSTLCEAVSTNRKYVLAKSTIRGFHSGFGDGQEDNSLVSQLYDKTLVTKDGDTLLQSPNLGQILAEARDLYDCTSRTHYRNKTSRDYSGVRMTWLLCGTSSLRSIDSSELGERFLDCVIMDGIDEDLEDEVLLRVAHRADRNLSIEANGKPESQQEPDLTLAMQLTGGYVNYLRENASKLLAKVTLPDWAKQKCIRLGKFVACMRARPSKAQEETEEREFAARLVSQHIRLAKCLAVVLNRKEVDEEVMRRTRKVALDTARGMTLQIAERLLQAEAGMEVRGVALLTGQSDDKVRSLLRFMRKLGIVQQIPDTAHRKWQLTKRLHRLVKEVVDP
jgi:hypothetical protein